MGEATGPFRAAVVGCGPRGLEHAQAMTRQEGTQLVAVADVSEPARREASESLGVAGYPDIDALLADVSPEIVSIVTPPHVRLPLVERAAASPDVYGIAVEKPLALSMPEAEGMVSLCDRERVLLVVCHQLRFVPHFVALKEAIDQGAIGRVEFLRAACYGDLLDQGPHLLDAIRWLSGGPRVLWAMSQRGDGALDRLPGHVADEGWIPPWTSHYLALEGGARAGLETGPLHQRGQDFVDDYLDKRISVVGSDGAAHCSAVGGSRVLRGSGSWEDHPGGMDAYTSATSHFYAELCEALRGRVKHRTEAHDALASLEGVLACAQSMADGDAAVLPLDRGRDVISDLISGSSRRASTDSGSAAIGETDELDVSVVVPIPDHRGYLHACIESWGAGQTLPGSRLEIIAASDGADPELDAETEGLLGPGDRLIVQQGASEIELYDAAARAARGRILLITEPHCMGEPDCLEELLGFLARTDFDGACLRTVAITPNAFGRLESRVFEEGFSEWSRPGHWCKVVVRGFAVTRRAYTEVGGFETGYGRFAEFALGASLHAQGYRLGYALGAAVNHAYAGSFARVEEPVTDFAHGEMAYRFDYPAEYCDRYFGAPTEWVQRRSLDRASARAACALAFRSMMRPRGLRDGSFRSMAGTLRRSGPAAIFGARAALLRARALYWVARARFLLWHFSGRRLDRAFRDGWERMVTVARLSYLAKRQSRPVPESDELRFDLAELPDETLYGFHTAERSQGRVFRWSGAVAFADLAVPRGSYRVLIDTQGMQQPPGLSFFFNGHRVGAEDVEIEEPGISFRVEPGWFSPSGAQRLALTCAASSPSGNGSVDPRELGLAVGAIEFREGSERAARVA